MPPERLSRPEFIAMIAMTVAITAFSIDAMLPAMSSIVAELTPENPNRGQLIVTVFALGMGAGTLFVGALVDAFGRKPVIVAGCAVYVLAAAVAWAAPTLGTLLFARFLQGVAASVPRIAAIAIIRDLYSGRQMAKIMSFVLVVFTLVPALAPAMGAGIMAVFGWRAIFAAFILFSVAGVIWIMLRQRETLAPKQRRPLNLKTFTGGIAEVVSNRLVARTIAAQCFVFGILFLMISSTQQVFESTFDRADSFPYWFGTVAVIAASASFLNAAIVERLGMRRVVTAAVLAQAAIAGVFLLLSLTDILPAPAYFAAYIVWMVSVFFMIGLTIGNLNALAMEPMGHLAGMAASVIGAISTIAGGFLAMLIVPIFDGTPAAVAALTLLYAVAISFIMRSLGTGPVIETAHTT